MAFDLTREQWKTFKTQNNLSKSWFSKADVGPTLDKFWIAHTACKNSPSLSTFIAFEKAAAKLRDAFRIFIELKETKNEMTQPAFKKITDWRNEIIDLVSELEKDVLKIGKNKLKEMQEKESRELLDRRMK